MVVGIEYARVYNHNCDYYDHDYAQAQATAVTQRADFGPEFRSLPRARFLPGKPPSTSASKATGGLQSTWILAWH